MPLRKPAIKKQGSSQKPLSKTRVASWSARIKKARATSGSGNPVVHSHQAGVPKKLAIEIEFQRLLHAHTNYLRSAHPSQRAIQKEMGVNPESIRRRAAASVAAVYKK